MPRTPSTATRTYAGRISVAAAARPILRGELDQIGLSTLLTMLEMERRTGLLVVRKNGARQAVRIEVRDGQVVRARAEGGKGPVGVEAVYQALAFTAGQFQLHAVKVTGRDEIGLRTAFLLMEGARRLDEARGGPAGPAILPDLVAI